MTNLQNAILFSIIAGAAMPAGALLARVEHIRPYWLEREFRHSVIAFGGGALLAGIAFVLVPEGIAHLSAGVALAAFIAGGLSFFWLDRFMARRTGSTAQLVAMLSDFLPEALAIGAMFAGGEAAAPLLAILIALQNLPEGFNAYRELMASRPKRSARNGWRVILAFCCLVPLGPAAAWAGHAVLADRPEVMGAIMLFAAGGILYLIFQDIAPQARLARAWAPPLGAIAGFALGLFGHMTLGG